MDTIQRAQQLLQGTEQSLRNLLEEALSAGDYQALATIAQWVDQLQEITGESPHSAANEVRPTPKSKARPKVTASKRYPVFERAGDQLVKIGWSKSKKSEYEQRADRKVLNVLVDALAKLSASNKQQVTMDEIFPLHEPEDGTEIPDYQAYLSLRWLRAINVVSKYGRNRYSLSVADPESLIESHWMKLPRRH